MNTKRRVEISKASNEFFPAVCATHTRPILREDGFTLMFYESNADHPVQSFNAYTPETVVRLTDWWINGKELPPCS